MFLAYNAQSELIDAESAQKKQQYTCWACGERVLLKKGSIKTPHFSHEKNSPCNGWNYQPMTQWHRDMQQYFSTTEVPMNNTSTGERHIADAVVRNGKDCIVFEFQHSSISPIEVWERTKFYLSMNCNIVWLFDLTDKFRKTIYPLGLRENGVFYWKNPFKSLQHLPLYRLHNRVRILFYWKEYDPLGNHREIINPVCWTPLKEEYNDLIEDYSPDFRVFAVSKQIVLTPCKKWPVRKMFEPINPAFSLFEKSAESYLEALNGGNLYRSSDVRFLYYHFHHKILQITILVSEEKWLKKLRDVICDAKGCDEIIVYDNTGIRYQTEYGAANLICYRLRYDFDVYMLYSENIFAVDNEMDY